MPLGVAKRSVAQQGLQPWFPCLLDSHEACATHPLSFLEAISAPRGLRLLSPPCLSPPGKPQRREATARVIRASLPLDPPALIRKRCQRTRAFVDRLGDALCGRGFSWRMYSTIPKRSSAAAGGREFASTSETSARCGLPLLRA